MIKSHSNSKKAKVVLAGVAGAAGLFVAGATQSVNADSVKVAKNDTVWSFAQKYNVSIKSIETLNKIDQKSHLIFVGQQLEIPGTQVEKESKVSSQAYITVTAKSGDSLWQISQDHGVSVAAIKKANNLTSNLILVGQKLKVPVAGSDAAKVSSSAATVQYKAPASTAQSSAASTVAQSSVASASVESSSQAKTATSATVASSASQDSSVAPSSQSVSSEVSATSDAVSASSASSQSVASTSTSSASSAVSSSAVSQAPASQAPASESSSKAVVAQATSSAASTAPKQVSTAAKKTVYAASSQASTVAAVSSATAPKTVTASSTASKATASSATTTQKTSTTTNSNLTSGSVVSLAVKLANANIPYVWGGSSLSGMDCSGLVAYVFEHAEGVSLPHYTVSLESSVTQKSVSAAQPGDLLFWGAKGATYHVAIYIGNNQYVAAPQPGQNVDIETISSYFAPSFAGTVK